MNRFSRFFATTTTRAPRTIFALSSGSGKAGVALIRISGSEAGLRIESKSSCRELIYFHFSQCRH